MMAQQKPHILLIILDTQRRDRLSIYGYPHETSPQFDAFAADSTRFERAVAPAQWTVPAHASLFTGVYPSTHQVTQADHRLTSHYPTLAERLRDGGYHTAGFCNNPLVGILNNGLQRGFIDFYNYSGAAPNRPLDVQRSGMRKALSRQWRRFARAVSNQFAHSDWLFRVSLHPRITPIWTRSVNYKGHTERSITDLIGYIDQHRKHRQKPLFAFLNLMGTHLPYRPPQDYLPADIRRSKAAYRVMSRLNADAARWASPVESPLSADEQHIIDAFYNAEIAHQDVHLGRLLRYLKTSGMLDYTMVIIAADHGEGHGDHGFFGHSFVVYQELVHVPLVIHYPARYPAGKQVMTNVSTRRIFHTILDAAGIAGNPVGMYNDAGTRSRAPLQHDHDVVSLSLVHALNGKPDVEQGIAFAEAFPPHTLVSVIQHRSPQLIQPLRLTHVRRGVYHNGHKLAVVGSAVEGLFDVNADPAERHNIAALQTPLVDHLRERIDTFVQSAEAQRLHGAPPGQMSVGMVEHLRALGYIE